MTGFKDELLIRQMKAEHAPRACCYRSGAKRNLVLRRRWQEARWRKGFVSRLSRPKCGTVLRTTDADLKTGSAEMCRKTGKHLPSAISQPACAEDLFGDADAFEACGKPAIDDRLEQ